MKATSQILLAAAALLLAIAASAQTVPTIIVQPVSQATTPGATITLTVSASGAGTLAYQWQKNTTNMANGAFAGRATVSGAATTALTLTGITTNDQANYACRLTNSYGNITSSIASLTVFIAPQITQQPAGITTNAGSTVSFTANVSGTLPFSYQWSKDGNPITWATLNGLTLSGVSTNDAGTYTVKVTNPAGSATSAGAVLLVIPNAPPTITTQPQSQTTPVGSNVSFTVSATGTVPLTYQWSLNGSNVVGATASAYSIPSAQTSMAGGYAVVVTNIYGSVTSAVANLIVGYPPVMVDQIPTVTTSNGNVTTLRCRVTGSNPLAYQWLRLGVAVIDATNTAITLTNIQTYYLVIDIGYTFG